MNGLPEPPAWVQGTVEHHAPVRRGRLRQPDERLCPVCGGSGTHYRNAGDGFTGGKYAKAQQIEGEPCARCGETGFVKAVADDAA